MFSCNLHLKVMPSKPPLHDCFSSITEIYDLLPWAYLVMTIETASLRILSPNTNMFNVGSTSKAWKMASVATGSTAEISDPNAKL